MRYTQMQSPYMSTQQYLPIAIVCVLKAFRASHNSNAYNRQCLLVMPVVVPRGSTRPNTGATRK